MMLKHAVVLSAMCCLITAELPVQAGVKPTNVIGSPEQHASFSFIRPGLTQTSFAFAGPSSHQSFAASIGNPELIQKVQPSIAQALVQRNPNLGYYAFSPATSGVLSNFATGPYQAQTVDPAVALTYAQQLQQPQQTYLHAYQPGTAVYQSQLAQLFALRQAQLAQQGQLHTISSEQVPEGQARLQQEQQVEQQSQNLLGVAYSSAPTVARVKVSGNGYKFNF
ncbi:uncharacterized protein LOC105838222 isoform X2 [Monomorium pharaonis]|uniref:uncharacterized protein LOC105838222 isoform X2 n=1 Tax=Monomorium pharaonis TaxID=307658 RepID=UPI00063F7309|nr:uncharacterized protein LOC105838222 isoform X2 [Monomorium pharaonis]